MTRDYNPYITLVGTQTEHFLDPSKHPLYSMFNSYDQKKIIYDTVEEFQTSGPHCTTFCVNAQGFWKGDKDDKWWNSFQHFIENTEVGLKSKYRQAVLYPNQ